MLVETLNGLREPTRIKANRVVIYDDMGNPLGVFVTVNERYHLMETIDHNPEAFRKLLHELGVACTTIVTEKQTPPLQSAVWTP